MNSKSEKNHEKIFVLDHNQPAYMMRNKFEAFFQEIKKEKYNLILKILNDLFEFKQSTLCGHKLIKFYNLENENISKIINSYKKEIEKTLSIKVPKDIGKKNIYDLICEMLAKIDYSIIKNKLNVKKKKKENNSEDKEKIKDKKSEKKTQKETYCIKNIAPRHKYVKKKNSDSLTSESEEKKPKKKNSSKKSNIKKESNNISSD